MSGATWEDCLGDAAAAVINVHIISNQQPALIPMGTRQLDNR
jgi:hypothetical protein